MNGRVTRYSTIKETEDFTARARARHHALPEPGAGQQGHAVAVL